MLIGGLVGVNLSLKPAMVRYKKETKYTPFERIIGAGENYHKTLPKAHQF